MPWGFVLYMGLHYCPLEQDFQSFHHRRSFMSNEATQKQGGFHYAYLIVASCIAITCLP